MKKQLSLIILLAFSFSISSIAQNLPSPWVSNDVGSPSLAGNASFEGGVFTVNGAGVDTKNTWDISDQFQFAYQIFTGNVSITAKLDTMDNISDWSKSGIMIRESLESNSKFVMMNVNPLGHQHLFSRTVAGATVAQSYKTREDFPRWYRLVRVGETITGYKSVDGVAWTETGVVEVSMGSEVYVGLAVHSHVVDQLNKTVFSNVTVENVSSLPSPWTSTDVGSPSLAGNASFEGGVFTVNGAGVDTKNTWDISDQFQFAYQTFTGNVSITAKLDTMDNISDWSKSGIMIRESLESNSKFVMMNVNPLGHQHLFSRTVAGATVAQSYKTREDFPRWYRLVRVGETITGYKSVDGVAWTETGVVEVSMGSEVYVGLAVHSHVADQLNKTVFSNVTVQEASAVGVEELAGIPTEFALKQNYPNPFNPATKIVYSITQASKVRLEVFDILGRNVATLIDEEQQAGQYRVDFDGSKLSSGVYVYRLSTPGLVQSKKMMLMK